MTIQVVGPGETVASILEKGPEVADLIRREVGLPE